MAEGSRGSGGKLSVVAKAKDAEGSLLARIASGDLAAFEALLALHQDAVYRTARRILHDDAEAEDITQDAFLRLWQQSGRFEAADGGVGGWLQRVARNLAIDRLRRAGRLTEFNEGHEPSVAAQQPEGLDRQCTAHAVQKALGDLPDRQRVALVLFHYEEQPVSAVAEQLGITASAAESLLSRARRTLKSTLKDVWQDFLD